MSFTASESGDPLGDGFAFSVSGAGDVNGDGSDDLIVGANGDGSNVSQTGNALVLSGSDGIVLYNFAGDSVGDLFGWSVSGAGDVNGDGFDDLIVGARGDDNNGTSSQITILGDCNLDGEVTFFDIAAFIAVLQAGDFLEQADTNVDGEVNFSDIAPFIAILQGQ